MKKLIPICSFVLAAISVSPLWLWAMGLTADYEHGRAFTQSMFALAFVYIGVVNLEFK